MNVSPLMASSTGPPLAEQSVQIGGRRGVAQLVAKRAVGEHLRELGQKLQVLLGRVLRHEQHEHFLHGLAVGSVEGDRLGESRKRALRLREALDATVRNGDALAEPRRAELLACGEAVDDRPARDAERALEQRPYRVEQSRL